MRKLFVSLLSCVILLGCFTCLVACNNGYEIVKSVTITTNGETKTFKSGSVIVGMNSEYVSEEEYKKAPSNKRYDVSIEPNPNALTNITIEQAIKGARGSTKYTTVEKNLVGFYYYQRCYNVYTREYYYLKCEYRETYCLFVYVKIKDDHIISIKDHSGETTYVVSSYQITKF